MCPAAFFVGRGSRVTVWSGRPADAADRRSGRARLRTRIHCTVPGQRARGGCALRARTLRRWILRGRGRGRGRGAFDRGRLALSRALEGTVHTVWTEHSAHALPRGTLSAFSRGHLARFPPHSSRRPSTVHWAANSSDSHSGIAYHITSCCLPSRRRRCSCKVSTVAASSSNTWYEH